MFHVNGLDMNACESTRWYTLFVGCVDNGVHSLHWLGPTLLQSLHRRSSVAVGPQTYQALDMVSDRTGTFLLESLTEGEAVSGMTSSYFIDRGTLTSPVDTVFTNITRHRIMYIQGQSCLVLGAMNCFISLCVGMQLKQCFGSTTRMELRYVKNH